MRWPSQSPDRQLKQLNTQWGFWTNMLDGALHHHHHHQNINCGNILWKIDISSLQYSSRHVDNMSVMLF